MFSNFHTCKKKIECVVNRVNGWRDSLSVHCEKSEVSRLVYTQLHRLTLFTPAAVEQCDNADIDEAIQLDDKPCCKFHNHWEGHY